MARPFVVNVREELQHPGRQRRLELAGTLPGAGVVLQSARVPAEGEVAVDATVEAQAGSVIVRGTATAPWVGECRRCLGPTGGTIEVELHEVFEESPVEGETFLLAGDQVDLAPVLAEALALGLPLAPLCADDCAGPDPEAHPVGTVTEPDDDEADDGPPGDPRWAVLDQLRADR
jgi:uncharacterized protein